MADPADIVTRLRAVLHNDRSVELMNREAADEIECLRAERDEARREVCQLKRINFEDKITTKAYAELRKWDCFKDHAND
jgi:hypothetical protein